MVRAMLAVCSLARDASDAESYALQATMKQAVAGLEKMMSLTSTFKLEHKPNGIPVYFATACGPSPEVQESEESAKKES